MNKSHVLGPICTILLTSTPASAHAASIVFGAHTDSGSCSEIRRSSCSKSITTNTPINTPAFSSPTGIIVRGQASANSGVLGAATADLRVEYDIPYSITRDVTVTPGTGGALATFERFHLDLGALYVFKLSSKDDFGQIGGAQSARAFNASVTSLGGFFTPISISGASVSGDNNNATLISNGDGIRFTPALNASGPRHSEANTDAQGIPADFRAWDDFLSPQIQDYSQPFSFTQTLDDVIRVSFRLRADSRLSGFLSPDGGAAIACAGLESSLSRLLVDDTNCVSSEPGPNGFGPHGLFVGADITNLSPYQTVVGAVPVPAAVWLFASGLIGLIGIARRKT